MTIAFVFAAAAMLIAALAFVVPPLLRSGAANPAANVRRRLRALEKARVRADVPEDLISKREFQERGEGHQFRVEVNQQYRTRWFELLMVHKADHGSLPADNAKNPPPLGRLSPA